MYQNWHVHIYFQKSKWKNVYSPNFLWPDLPGEKLLLLTVPPKTFGLLLTEITVKILQRIPVNQDSFSPNYSLSYLTVNHIFPLWKHTLSKPPNPFSRKFHQLGESQGLFKWGFKSIEMLFKSCVETDNKSILK